MRRSRKTALSAEPRLLYADSSALVKLLLAEPESAALLTYIEAAPHTLATSRIAVVEVQRAVRIANPTAEGQRRAERVLASCLLLNVSPELLRDASSLASRELRTLDAIHLASAAQVSPDVVLTYDRRLANAARRLRFDVQAP